ncbi:MAG: signal transduction histidine kinase [Saprospiraceae bacterium]|jgi:signal transduction histidine kinase
MENVILGPDNFLLFVILFTTSLGFAVFTFLSYERSFLIYINTGMFLLCAVRACTEFWMQLTNSPEDVYLFNLSNSIIVHLCFTLSWFLLYYYIEPFKYFRYSKVVDIIVSVFLIGLPNLIICYFFVTFQLFEFSTEKIGGYWMFRPIPSPILAFYQIYTFLIMVGLYTSAIMIYSIIVNPLDRVKKISLLLAFYGLTTIIIFSTLSYSSGTWKVINYTIPMLIDGIILTWFISGYRLLNDQYQSASIDVLNSISELIIRTDKHFNILNQNAASQEIFKSDAKNLSDLLNTGYIDNEPMDINYLINDFQGKTQIRIEIDGIPKYLNTRVAPYLWRGSDMGYSFILSDVTKLKQSEQALSHSNNTKDQLFSIISHDLRKPALAFRGITKKINNLLKKEDFVRLNLLGDSIEKSAQNLNALLDNLLQWALTLKEGIKPKAQKFKIIEIIDNISEHLEIISKEKGISVDRSNFDSELEIDNDPDLFATIIRNIIDNAIKYSSEHGVIYVNGSERGDKVHVIIKDDGVGMSDEQQDKLSTLYEQKSTRGTHGERGSGLGMSLVYDLVDRTGGELKVNSKSGAGTVMTLVYPNPLSGHPPNGR